ncbi:MAG: phytoene desaturase [Spartobacteria bacterium]|nr:phytoene desaturase [Spartobacteria bacterium]
MAEHPEKKHIVVVGAGPGGLTAAMILAYRGFRVTVCEAQHRVGGRNGALELGPYTFDIGPTFLMLKSILDEVFHEAGGDADTAMDMRRLDPMYRLQYQDAHIDATTDHEKMKSEIARVFPGHEDRYEQFFNQEQTRFRYLFPCLQKSYHRFSTMLGPDLLKAVPHLAMGRSLYDVMYGTFGKQDLALAFTFQAKYLGMSPWECPGLFSMIPYIEHAFGIYHPIGGLSRISETMADQARQNGADIRLNAPVEQVLVKDRQAQGVRLVGGEVIEADEVVINADFGYAAQHLFEPGILRKYTPQKLEKLRLSCSIFMLYLGLDKLYDMPHHTIFFAKDYRRNVEDVFHLRDPGTDISFYIRNASALDSTLAPEGHSAVYVLTPVANLRAPIDWAAKRESFREVVLQNIEARSPMKDIRAHIKEEKIIGPLEWRDDLNVYEGATFNLAHNIPQMLYFRPRNKFEEVGHCYLVGGGTHPGSGLPTIYESGRIAANLISRAHQVSFVSGNLEV